MRLGEALRDRCKHFGSCAIRTYSRLPRSRRGVEVLGHQMLRAGTSVAAHAREASRARSDAEFCSKINGLLQEADETQLWLEYLEEECGIDPAIIRPMRQEAEELISIFVTIASRTTHAKPDDPVP